MLKALQIARKSLVAAAACVCGLNVAVAIGEGSRTPTKPEGFFLAEAFRSAGMDLNGYLVQGIARAAIPGLIAGITAQCVRYGCPTPAPPPQPLTLDY